MNVTDPLRLQAEKRPGAEALVAGNRRLSFGELDAAIGRASAWIAGLGLPPGARVGVSFRDTLPLVVVQLALARCGIAQIVLTGADPAPLRRTIARRLALNAMIGDAADAAEAGLPVAAPDPDALLEGRVARDPPAPCADPSAAWLVMRSSGSTGEPKFALLSHAAGLARFGNDMSLLPFRQDERYLSMVSPLFTVAQQRIVFCLGAGGCVVLPTGVTDVAGVAELVARERVGYLSGVPSHAAALVEHHRDLARLLAGVRVLRIGAAQVSGSLQDQVSSLLTPNLYVNYGSNEAGTIAIASPADRARVPDTVGYSAPGVDVEVVDRQGQPVPAGEAGLVRVRGPNVVSGYLDDPQADARAFVAGWFLPGDVGRQDTDGALVLLGRSDDMMIFDGINIYPVEIENALRRHPDVVDAQAFPLPGRHRNQVPAAAVVVRRPIGESELIRFARGVVGVKAPRAILFVDAFPRNAMGKVLKKECAALLAARLRDERSGRPR